MQVGDSKSVDSNRCRMLNCKHLAPLNVDLLLNRNLISSVTSMKGNDSGSVNQNWTTHQNLVWNWSVLGFRGNPECFDIWLSREVLLGQLWFGDVA